MVPLPHFAEGVLASEKYHLGSLAYLRSTGVSLASCGALEELRIKTIDLLHFVADLEELLPTPPNTTNLSRIVLDADQRARGKLTENCRETLDAVLVECTERVSAKRNNRRLTVQLCTEKEGATGEHDEWAREIVERLVFFSESWQDGVYT